ncbi:MAG: T9SS type A sorting domain-containing protein, partial [Bacteroidota bacterium]
MKKLLILSLSILSLNIGQAQTIDFEETSTFQDADVGSMAFGDIDQDGDQDLLISGKGGPVKTTLYRNDGSGNFVEIMGTSFIDVYGGTVGFVDVNNDSFPDILITGATSAPVKTATLYLNDGAGNYSILANTPFAASQEGDFDFGDLDDDGDQDIIMIGYNVADMGFSSLYLNDGAGNFTEAMGLPFPSLWNGAVELLDIDNDDDLDVIMTGTDANANPSTTLYTNDGAANFSLVPNTPFDHCNGGDIKHADADNDGDQDILICGQNDSGTIISKLYLNDGNGSFSLLANTPFPGVNLGESAFADFDNDGDQDVLILGTGPGGLADNSIVANIYENQGNNSFALVDSLFGAYFASNAIADIDGDHDLDLVIGGTSTGSPVRAARLYTNMAPTNVSIEPAIAFKNSLVYPNPTQAHVYIQITERSAQQYQWKLTDIQGNNLMSGYENRPDFTLNLSHHPRGLYFIIIETEAGITSH